MADEFITLAKSEEPNIHKYLNQLDRYLQERYRDQRKKESLWKKITKRRDKGYDFTALYDEAVKKSKKENCKVILAYINLLDTTQGINDKWITNNEIKKAIRQIRSKIQDYADDTRYELSKLENELKKLTNEPSRNLDNAIDKLNDKTCLLVTMYAELAYAKKLMKEINQMIKKSNY